jgi:anaerobic magnesium-protoporphyrin IX monomethyl ester cyclase
MLELSQLRCRQEPDSAGCGLRLALLHYGFRTSQIGFVNKRAAAFSPRHASLGLLNLARSLEVDFEAGLIDVEPKFKYFDEDNYSDDAEMAEAISLWLEPASSRFILAGLYSLAFERTERFLSLFSPSEQCIVVGGAHPTVSPSIDHAHVVVRGEGATAIRHIVNFIAKPDFGQGPEARGICYQLNGIEHSSKPAFDRSLATIPSPAFRYELFAETLAGGKIQNVRWWEAVGDSTQIYVCTQSCRARCTFCSTYLIHGASVSRPADAVKEDLRHIAEMGYDSIKFHDDDLLQHNELENVLEELKSSGLHWSCNARSEHVTSEIAHRLFASGCRRVFLGLESMSQRSLDYYRKHTTVADNERAVRVFDDAGIGVIAGYIIGAPHDDIDSVLEDLDRVLGLPIYFLSTAILTPDIGTVEFGRALKQNPILGALVESGRNDIRPRPDLFGEKAPFGLPTVCAALTKDELNELYQLVGASFFLRRSTLERVIRHTRENNTEQFSDWFHWMYDQALLLASESKLEPVRRRAGAVIENAGSLLEEIDCRSSRVRTYAE